MARDCGFPFMFGIYGKRATKESAALLKQTGACGVLLLARNIETAAQTRALTSELVQRVGRPLLFAVDHEGGWVLRFAAGVTAFPGNAALGAAKDPALAYGVGEAMGRELFRLGIQINLAPVLDVVSGYNPGIGIRSFGANPRLAGLLGVQFLRGLQDNGVCACAKHFPGKGAAKVDAHVALPRILLEEREFEKVHLAPFAAAVRAGVDCVMTSHVRFPRLDRAPATFSKKITEGLLRGKLGFAGAVISDDLCMGAVTALRPVQIAAAQALASGHDILLIAHDTQAMREAAELLETQVEAGTVTEERLAASRRRIERLFERSRRRPSAPDFAAARALAERIALRAVAVVKYGTLSLPLVCNGRAPLVLFPDFSQVKDKFTFEGGPFAPAALLRAVLKRWGPARVRLVPVESTGLGSLPEDVRRASRVLFFSFEARRFAGQRAALELVGKTAPERSVVAFLRGVWDRELVPPRLTAVDAGGYRLASLKAVLKTLLGAALLALALAAPPPARAASLTALHDAFVSATENARKAELLKAIEQAPPSHPDDVRALFDLFMRYPIPAVREAVMASVHRLSPQSEGLGSVFLGLLDSKQPESELFAINGALALREEKALPAIRRIAGRDFSAKAPDELPLVPEQNQWWVQYEALSALAQWEGPEALPLLRKKAKQSPRVAGLMARYLWKQSLPEIEAWARSKKDEDRRKAEEALTAEVDPRSLREARPEMLKAVRDSGTDKELRHQLALRVGASSTEEEVGDLLQEHSKAEDPGLKLLFAAAIFASRSPQAAPLLKSFVKDSPDAASRAGALAQLRQVAAPADYKATLEWAAANDTDEGNRKDARRQLQELRNP